MFFTCTVSLISITPISGVITFVLNVLCVFYSPFIQK